MTEREIEVLGLVARGMTNTEIAMLLGISHQTVKNHMTHIMNKLRVFSRTGAVVIACQLGYLDLLNIHVGRTCDDEDIEA